MFIWSGGGGYIYFMVFQKFLVVLFILCLYYYGFKGDMFKVYFDYLFIYCVFFVFVWYIYFFLRIEFLNDFVDQ